MKLGVPGGVPPKHDLSFLLQQISGKLTIPESIINAADAPDPYGIIVRYPSGDRVDDYLTRKALEQAKEVLDWVNKIIEETISP